MRKKVLILTYYFPPSGGSGVQRWLKFVKYLPSLDVEPVVISVDAACASYPQLDESLSDDISPDLKLYRTKTREVLSFYKKISPTGQLPHTGFANEKEPGIKQKISRFIRGNFFLPDPRRGWNKYAFKKACELIEHDKIDTVITTSPPHSTQLIGLKLKRKYPNIKWIADLRDPWTDIYYNKDLYQTSLAKAINARYERKVLESADMLVTVSEECRRNFQSKTSKPLPFTVIPNGFDEDDFDSPATNSVCDYGRHPVNNQFTISYVGSLAPQYDTDTFINALKLLPPEIQSQIHLQFVGGDYSEVKSKLSTVNCQLSTLNYLPHAAAVERMCASDMLLLLLPNQEENKGILTGKLFEYMATGNPVLAICFKDGDAANILDNYEQSGVFAFGESQEIADYIKKAVLIRESGVELSSEPQFTTNPAYARQFSRRSLTAKLVELL